LQGRSFAWQEAIIAIATIFQRFELRMADPSYTLRLRQTLTIKPSGFYFHAAARKGVSSLIATRRTEEPKVLVEEGRVAQSQPLDDKEARPTVHVLYGSNTGSSEAFAQRVASAAAGKGSCMFDLIISKLIDYHRFQSLDCHP
jgi:cytochrome P450 / NADPH-cytochrome P450 reductase